MLVAGVVLKGSAHAWQFALDPATSWEDILQKPKKECLVKFSIERGLTHTAE